MGVPGIPPSGHNAGKIACQTTKHGCPRESAPNMLFCHQEELREKTMSLEVLAWAFGIGLVLYFFINLGNASDSPAPSSKDSSASKDADLLSSRWDRLKHEHENGEIKTGPSWFFDPPTDRQIEFAKDLGLSSSDLSSKTKGQISDLIGLTQDPSPEDIEVLKFFKQPTRGLNETTARDKVQYLLSDPDKKSEFESRPPTSLEREVLRFAGIKAPKNVRKTDIPRLFQEKASEFNDEKAEVYWNDRVDEYEDILEEFQDRDFREEAEIKKPALSKIRKAVETLESEGHSLVEGDIDADDVAEKLIELYPELQK